jgi:hypothetical protein
MTDYDPFPADDDLDADTRDALRQLYGYTPIIVTLDDLETEYMQAQWREEQGF